MGRLEGGIDQRIEGRIISVEATKHALEDTLTVDVRCLETVILPGVVILFDVLWWQIKAGIW